MKTASFKMAFISGLMGLAYSSKEVTDGENNLKEEEQSTAKEEGSVSSDSTAGIEEPETNTSS